MKKLVFDRKKKNQKFADSKMMGNEFKHFVIGQEKGYKEQR
jgi:hypothetical protein